MTPPPAAMHAFTVDVEDWYHGIPISAERKQSAERRLEVGLNRLLELLAERETRGTFFILGPVAAEHPALLRQIAEAGHEVGCHGWSHDLLYQLTPAQFREETRRACGVISGITGEPVRAYRAAYFSITQKSLWALEVLAELGFRYDSSIFPVRNWRYGIPDYDPRPARVRTASGDILEFPISVRRIGGRNLPLCGGAYLRIYPYWLTQSNLRHAERAGTPAVFYLHPWELDPAHPRVDFHWKPKLTHYFGLRRTLPRLRRLLTEFRFAPLGTVLDHEIARTGA